MVNSGTMTRHARPLFPRKGAIWLALAVALGAASSAGCVEVNGGAAELSWSLRPFDGAGSWECKDVRIGWIRLAWKAVPESGSDPEDTDPSGAPDGWQEFPCEDSRGVTDFSIPAGQQMLWIVPICAGSALPAATGHYEVPPPIVRTVQDGTVTTLAALLVVTGESACPVTLTHRGAGGAITGPTPARRSRH